MDSPALSFTTSLEAAKDGFFDRDRVKKIMGEKKAKGFALAGGYIRTSIQNDIDQGSIVALAPARARGMEGGIWALDAFKSIHGRAPMVQNTSTPGKAPRSRSGLLKDKILYWNTSDSTMVIGPAKLGGKGNIPQTLEFGGVVRGKSILSRLQLTVGIDRKSGDSVVGAKSRDGQWLTVGLRNGKKVGKVEIKRGRVLPFSDITVSYNDDVREFRMEARPYLSPQFKKQTLLSKIRSAFNQA